MAIKDVLKVSRKTFFNPREWLGYDLIKSQVRFTWEIVRGLFTLPKGGRTETFEEAMARFELTAEDLPERQRYFRNCAILFLLAGLAMLGVAGYFVAAHYSLAGFFLLLTVTALLFANAFRFHFWAFQISQRKLGCTLTEWRRGKCDTANDTPDQGGSAR